MGVIVALPFALAAGLLAGMGVAVCLLAWPLLWLIQQIPRRRAPKPR